MENLHNLFMMLTRWGHLLFGIGWIGMIYYFNFVQIPTMPSVPAELKPGVTKYIAPKALLYFRHGSLLTVVAGIGLSGANLIEGLTFQEGQRVIGLGMWLGLIMAFNVWFLIWPNQKIALGIVDGTPEQKAKAGTTAMIFSRTASERAKVAWVSANTKGVLTKWVRS